MLSFFSESFGIFLDESLLFEISLVFPVSSFLVLLFLLDGLLLLNLAFFLSSVSFLLKSYFQVGVLDGIQLLLSSDELWIFLRFRVFEGNFLL